MSDPILPLAVWQSGTNENSLPANDNALRLAILEGLIISDSTTAQPGSPAAYDAYILAATHTGSQWASFSQYDLVIYDGDGTWHAYAPVTGIVVNVNGTEKRWTGSAYVAVTADVDTRGKQAIYIPAAAIAPSVAGGCAALAKIASAASQPDISTLDFDPTTQEYAQFSLVMPKKWNEGTVTFKAHWSHAATTTNFGVVWDLQAVAVGDDDAIATAFGTAQTSTDTGGTTNDLYNSPESSAITVGGSPGAEEMVFFRLSRVTGNGSDTMAVDARLHGITLYITTDASTDA